ncbi:serine/threonine protein kinase [Gigaspora margarita]|uniref:Serine/threonine protein kinase n=1 Tax=Gigaspora margarita TaxID=4874 RepID=A0A8H4AK65_GIGMA|nr:serine/threonine protein kinase [Gigaspora margarita]
MKKCWDNVPEKRPMASEIYEVIQSWKNNYELLLKFNKFETILEESGAIFPKAVYTSRFISFKELATINSLTVCTNGIISDDNKIIESQNNQIIENQEDNIPIKRMNKLMLEIEKDKTASVHLSLCE